MKKTLSITDIDMRVQQLRGDIFIEYSDTRRVACLIQNAVGEFLAAKELGYEHDARGIVVLGRSGTGKTASVQHALVNLGLPPSSIGDSPRHQLFVPLRDDVTLRRLRMLISLEFGWTPKARESAEEIWQYVTQYIDRLQTHVIVLDEIQHVRAAGPKDKKSMRDALKSLVQPQRGQVVPILIGMPEFEELLNSDQQFKRRYSVVHMTTLDAAADAKKAIQVLARYCKEVGIELGGSVKTRDFAERLLHASHYAFGEMCSICILAIKTALIAHADEITIEHFREAHALRFDCVGDMNPFLARDFLRIPASIEPGF